MKLSKVFGAALLLVGIGLVGYWADRSFVHPTSEDLRIQAAKADYGGVASLSPDPKKIFFFAGVAAVITGGALLKK